MSIGNISTGWARLTHWRAFAAQGKETAGVAMAAPPGGYSPYSRDEVEAALVTAFSVFRAAVLESRRARGADAAVAVHTGYWGCGAFGGNRVLMALLQVLAAGMAGVDRLVFHTGPAGDASAFESALVALGGLEQVGEAEEVATSVVIGEITRLGFAWGVSDGN
jgi:hypothetical protein